MYKILRYLYECMKQDIAPDLQKYGWHSELLDIPRQYWCKIIRILVDKRLAVGFSILVEITYEGREFLRENSGMKKAQVFCGEAFEVLLSAAVGVIL